MTWKKKRGQLRYNQHNLNEALKYLKKSLEIRNTSLGAKNPLTLQTSVAYEELLQTVGTSSEPRKHD